LGVDERGRRLAKRHDPLSVRELRRRGLSPNEILAADGHLPHEDHQEVPEGR
jgi:hypothetical protein